MKTFKQFLAEKKDEPEDDYYYHITKGSNMTGIAKRGLVRNSGHKNYNFSKRKSVYLSSSPKSTKQYAADLGRTYKFSKVNDTSTAIPHSLRIIKIHKSKVNPKLMQPDRNMQSFKKGVRVQSSTEWEYKGDISAKDITFSGGETLRKNSKPWKKTIQYS